MTRLHEQHLFTGEVLVAEKANVVYEGVFGVAERSAGRPYMTETRSCLASLSKPITAAAIMMLAEQHRLTYDDPLSKFLPGFADAVGVVTIRHCQATRLASAPSWNGASPTGSRSSC